MAICYNPTYIYIYIYIYVVWMLVSKKNSTSNSWQRVFLTFIYSLENNLAKRKIIFKMPKFHDFRLFSYSMNCHCYSNWKLNKNSLSRDRGGSKLQFELYTSPSLIIRGRYVMLFSWKHKLKSENVQCASLAAAVYHNPPKHPPFFLL